MRQPRFLHVGLTFVPGLDIGTVDRVIESEALDWIRYSYCCYVVWTVSDAEIIVRKLRRIAGLENAFIFVVSFDFNADGFGWLPPNFWDWLGKDRGQGSLPIWHPTD